MKHLLAEVRSNREVMPGVNLMWLQAPGIAQEAQPGQFVLVRCGEGYEPLLRRALSIHRIGAPSAASPERGCALLYGIHGSGTGYLRRLGPGDTLDVLGPLGRGFTVHAGSRNLLLVAGGWGTSPLVALIEQQVVQGRAVTLLAGAAHAALLYPPALLPPEAEVVTATEDGSAGHKGRVVDLVGEYWSWADEVFACGPGAMYPALGNVTESLWPRKPVQVLVEMAMACGVGACYACTIETKRGPKLACRDGPRFYLKDLLF